MSQESPPPPKAVVHRLSLYSRELQRLQREGQETISSTQLGKLLGLSDAQVRKDLAYFGQFGYPGVGYRCDELTAQIRRILGTDRRWPVFLVGVGHLGQALLGYRGFGEQGFQIVAAFDVDPAKVGANLGGVPVLHLDEIGREADERGVRLAVLAVPATVAQDVAERLASEGVHGILNFAPVTLKLPPGVSTIGVDLAIELEQLLFAVVQRQRSDGTTPAPDESSGDAEALGE